MVTSSLDTNASPSAAETYFLLEQALRCFTVLASQIGTNAPSGGGCGSS
jgi:hypothetical protein